MYSPDLVADICAEIVINATIKKNFPDELIIGEEDGTVIDMSMHQSIQHIFSKAGLNGINVATAADVAQILQPGTVKSPARYWTVDPIDGTKGFIRGDQYAVCIALVDCASGDPIIACMGCPNLTYADYDGVIAVCIKGHGIYCTDLNGTIGLLKPISNLSLNSRLDDAVFTGAFEQTHTKTIEIDTIKKHVCNATVTVRLDSQAKYLILALGLAQVYYRRHQNPGTTAFEAAADYTEAIWDNAPGAAFVVEVGGQVTDFAGNPLKFNEPKPHFTIVGGVLASTLTKEAHERVLGIINTW